MDVQQSQRLQAGRGAEEEAVKEASFQGREACVAGGEQARREVRHEASRGGEGRLYEAERALNSILLGRGGLTAEWFQSQICKPRACL